MTIRFSTQDGEKIITTDYLEIEEADKVECHDGKWVFKDEQAQT